MKTVWILFSLANEYNQPDKAFEAIYFTAPTAEELGKQIGIYPQYAQPLLDGEEYYDGGAKYWLESFTEPQPEVKKKNK